MLTFSPTESIPPIIGQAMRVYGLYLVYEAVFEQSPIFTDELKTKLRVERYSHPLEGLPNQWDGGKVDNLLFIGGGGLGDRIQMTPALKEVSRRAGCPVDVCSVRDALEWRGLDYIGNIGEDFPAKPWVQSYQAAFTIEGVISRAEATSCAYCHRPGVPLHILFASAMNVEIELDALPDYRILPGEERLVYLPPKEKPRVGIHFGQASPARIWPPSHWVTILNELSKDFEIILLGYIGESPQLITEQMGTLYRPPPPGPVIDYAGHTPNIRALAVALNTCDLFIGTDSAPLHLAGTLGIPSIGLYGPFPYNTRGTNLPSVTPLEIEWPRAECKTCYTHVQHGQKVPCGRAFCDMMVGITPGMVLNAAAEVLRNSVPRRLTIQNLDELRYGRNLSWQNCARVLGVKESVLREARKGDVWTTWEAAKAEDKCKSENCES